MSKRHSEQFGDVSDDEIMLLHQQMINSIEDDSLSVLLMYYHMSDHAVASESGRQSYRYIRRRRTTSDRLNLNANSIRWESSTWWQMLNKTTCPGGPSVWLDASAIEHSDFKRRFRIPHGDFLSLVNDIKHHPGWAGCFPNKTVIPVELKVLGVLRQLGRDLTCDDVAEYGGYSAETQRTFFHCLLLRSKSNRLFI